MGWEEEEDEECERKTKSFSQSKITCYLILHDDQLKIQLFTVDFFHLFLPSIPFHCSPPLPVLYRFVLALVLVFVCMAWHGLKVDSYTICISIKLIYIYKFRRFSIFQTEKEGRLRDRKWKLIGRWKIIRLCVLCIDEMSWRYLLIKFAGLLPFFLIPPISLHSFFVLFYFDQWDLLVNGERL